MSDCWVDASASSRDPFRPRFVITQAKHPNQSGNECQSGDTKTSLIPPSVVVDCWVDASASYSRPPEIPSDSLLTPKEQKNGIVQFFTNPKYVNSKENCVNLKIGKLFGFDVRC